MTAHAPVLPDICITRGHKGQRAQTCEGEVPGVLDRLAGERVERLGQVSQQVFGVLTAGTEPDKTLGDGIATPAGASLCSGVEAAKTGGFVDQLTGRQEGLGPLTVGEHKTDHWSETLHLAHSNGMGRVVR